VSRLAWVSLLAAAVALLAVVAAGAFLIGGKDSEPSAQQPAPASGPFALPLAESPSALAVAKHERSLLVGVAARPGGPVEVAALRAEDAVPTEDLRLQLDGRAVEAKSCGAGCSRIDAPVLRGSSSRLSVSAGSSTLTFDLPAALPPSGASLFDHAQRTMAGLHSFRYLERLSSGGATVVTRYKVEAPNRLQLRTASGFETVIIGHERWDYHGDRWEHTPFPGLTMKEVLMWFQAKNARIVGRKNGLTELAAFGLEPVPAWFRLEVEPNGRVADAEMIAPSHFMVHRYSDFDGDLSIEAPR
jgi:hypothetical protein